MNASKESVTEALRLLLSSNRTKEMTTVELDWSDYEFIHRVLEACLSRVPSRAAIDRDRARRKKGGAT